MSCNTPVENLSLHSIQILNLKSVISNRNMYSGCFWHVYLNYQCSLWYLVQLCKHFITLKFCLCSVAGSFVYVLWQEFTTSINKAKKKVFRNCVFKPTLRLTEMLPRNCTVWMNKKWLTHYPHSGHWCHLKLKANMKKIGHECRT
jgi:hypothetical protein